MVSDGAKFFDKWWMAVFPGFAILMVVMAANFLGDTLRDGLDPKTGRGARMSREPLLDVGASRSASVRTTARAFTSPATCR